MSRCRLMALALGLLVVNLALCGDAADKEAEKLQGTWFAEKTVVGGKEQDKDAETVLVMRGETVSWTYTRRMGDRAKSSSISFTFKLDPKAKPPQIDLMATEGTFAGKVFPSIYSLEGDTLKICRSQPGTKRPTEFVSKQGSDHWLLVLKKKPAPDEKK